MSEASLSLDQIHSELDQISLQNLELSQDLIHAKLKLERLMRDGFLLMAKSRYSNGINSVSSSQIPCDDAEFQSNIKVESRQCLRSDCNVRFNYFSIQQPNTSVGMEMSTLSHRKNLVTFKDEDVMKKENHDPLKWFGILVPTTLKQSQSCFQNGIDLSVEIANMQSEILGILNRKKYLLRMKLKLDKESDASQP